MANEEDVQRLKQGVNVWNTWHKGHADYVADLRWADFSNADLRAAKLNHSKLNGTNLSGADLSGASLVAAHFKKTNLREANLVNAHLNGANLYEADLSRANLSGANLNGAKLNHVDLSGANFTGANLMAANMTGANLNGADLTEADLTRAILVETNLSNAILSNCRIYGISAWNIKLIDTAQSNLIITRDGESTITVDNVEVGQFIYLLLNNAAIRNVIDTVTSKAVLILGRFTDERKAVLDAIREALRLHDYLPILFDFEKSSMQSLTQTVMTLAGMSRFVIADLSDPNSVPHEVMSFVEKFRSVPLQPIFCPVSGHETPYAMFEDFADLPQVLPIYQYESQEQLLPVLYEMVIHPAEEKVKALKSRGKSG